MMNDELGGCAACWPYAPVAKPSEILATKSEPCERTVNWCVAPCGAAVRLAWLAENLLAVQGRLRPSYYNGTMGGEKYGTHEAHVTHETIAQGMKRHALRRMMDCFCTAIPPLKTSNLEPATGNSKPQTPNPKLATGHFPLATGNWELGTLNPKLQGSGATELATSNWQLGTGHWELKESGATELATHNVMGFFEACEGEADADGGEGGC